MNNISIEDRILKLIHDPNYRPLKPRGLHQRLELNEDEYVQVRRAIKNLAQLGKLKIASNHLVLPSEQNTGTPDQIQGTFRLAYGGFGFVRPVSEAESATKGEDVFIPAKYVGSAMDGDQVQVRIRAGREGKIEGAIQQVIKRARRQFTGTYQLLEGKAIVWLDGVAQQQPVQIGDVRGLPVDLGDKVVVELVRYPEGILAGEGVIMEVLGSSKNPAVDTIAVMRQFNLIDEFPEPVIEQSRAIADAHDENVVPEGRQDLTQVPTITIDPFDARDFDDAISLARNEVGHWVLQVHIADVANFVPAGTPLDDEAQDRATSVYLPDKVIPMLPEIISNHLASLQPDRNRLTKTVLMEMTDQGMMVHWEVFNSVIRNAKRLNYEQVDDYLKDPEPWRERLSAEVFELLRNMHTLAMTLRRNRMQGGSLELALPEIKIDLDRNGKVKGAHLQLHTESHQVIEEFMLAANQAVATWLDDRQIPFLRRAHAPPKRIKLKRLTEFVKDLGIPCDNLEDRFEIQRVVDFVRGQSTEYAVNYAILKSMSKAVYQPELERHYALDMSHYCHFTSPIRRYPDLTVHRIIDKLLTGGQPREPMPLLEKLGQHCSDQEQNAEAAERELIHVKLLHFMSKRIGERVPGIITTVRPEGFVVRGKEIPAEGFVPIESLPNDQYRYERHAHSIEGFRHGHRYRLGDEVVVLVDRVDLARRQLWFLLDASAPVKHAPSPRASKRPDSSTKPGSNKRGSAKTKKKMPKRGRDVSPLRKKHRGE